MKSVDNYIKIVELNISALLSYADRIIEEVEIPVDALGWIAGLMTIFKGLVGEFRALNGKVAKVVELESLLIIQKNTTDVLKNENDRFNKRINSLEMIVDNNEQHNRNINLVLHGVAEKNGENTTNLFVDSLSPRIQISNGDIARIHRLGPPRNCQRP